MCYDFCSNLHSRFYTIIWASINVVLLSRFDVRGFNFNSNVYNVLYSAWHGYHYTGPYYGTQSWGQIIQINNKEKK